ncbi:MAG TPA: YadA-like family protein [Stenotrophomonas sp.]|nr:YadA-like family protein [Stenotrophomonas sp.]
MSVGNASTQRQIINVARGTADTDAATVGQLNEVSKAVADPLDVHYNDATKTGLRLAGAGGTRIENLRGGLDDSDAVNLGQLRGAVNGLGGGAKINPDGSVAGPTYTVAGKPVSNVGDALAALDKAAADPLDVHYDDDSKSRVSLGGANGTRVGNLQAGLSDSEAVNVSQLRSAGFTFDNAGAVNNPAVTYLAGSLASGSPRVVLDPGAGNSVYFTDGDRNKPVLPKGTVISNVADGVQDTDAANIGQVKSLSQKAIEARDRAAALRATESTQQVAPAAPTRNGAPMPKSAAQAMLRMSSNETVTQAASAEATSTAPSGGTGIESEKDKRTKFLEAGNWYLRVSGRGDAVGQTPPTDQAQNPGAASIAIGSDARAFAENGTSMGVQALVTSSAKDAVALGAGSVANEANTVSVGSLGRPEDNFSSYDAQSNKVTITNVANTRRIVNMAAGRNDTDAVNLSQLKGVASAIGGGAEIGTDGTIKRPSYKVGDSTFDNVGDALNAVSTTATQADTMAVKYSDASKTGVALQGEGGTRLSNVRAAAADTDAVNLRQLKDAGLSIDPNTGSVTNSFVAYDGADKAKITLGGTDGTTLSNVKAGVAAKDAVNVSQLQSTGLIDSTGAVRKAVLFDADGSEANANAAGKKIANVAAGSRDSDAVNLKQLKDAGLTIDPNTGTATNAFVGYDDSAKSKVTFAGEDGTTLRNVKAGTADMDAVNFKQLKDAGITIDPNTGVVTNSFVAYDGADKAKITLGGADGTTLSNVKAGVAARDAVNVSQLQSSGLIDANGAVQKAVLFNADGTEANANAAGRKIANVAAGSRDSDAVNLKQLKDAGLAVDPNTGVVSNAFVGYDGSDKTRITFAGQGGTTLSNVKAGTADMDAVNFKQLKDAGITVDPNTGSVTNSFVAYDSADKAQVTFGGADGTRLSNVKAGVAAKDAVNVSQLQSTGLIDANGAVQKAMLFNADGDAANANADGKQLANLAAGSRDSDAVNLKQLKDAGLTIDPNTGAATNAFVSYDDASKSAVTLGGGDGGTLLRNVRAGTAATDAANIAQARGLAEAIGGGAGIGPNGEVVKPTYTLNGKPYDSVGDALKDLDRRAIDSSDAIAGISDGRGIKYFRANSTESDANASGANAVAMGPKSVAAGENATAAGAGAQASADATLAAGYNAVAMEKDAVALGSSAKASKARAIALGNAASVVGTGGIAVGASAIANADNTVSLGTNAAALENASVAVGMAARSKHANSVALGAGSVTSDVNTVAVGSPGNTRRITSVGEGKSDTDAVNLKQLKDAGLAVDKGTGVVSNSFVAYDGADKGQVTLKGADGTTLSNVKAGVAEKDAVNVGQLTAAGFAVDNNTGTVTTRFVAYDGDDKGKISFAGADGTTLSNVKAGVEAKDAVNVSQLQSAGLIDAAGKVQRPLLFDGVDGSANAAGQRLVNLAAGTGDSDAVNIKQLKDAGFVFNGGTVITRGITYVPGSMEAGAPRVELATGSGKSGYFADVNGDGIGDRSAPLPQGTRISNLAKGVLDTDAAVVGQLRDLTNSTFNPIYNAFGAGASPSSTPRMSAMQTMSITANATPADSGVDSVSRQRAVAMKQGNYYLKVNGRGDATGSTAPTDEATATGLGGISIGSDSGSTAENSMAFGSLARSTAKDSVALGAGSVADQDNTISVGSAKANSYEAYANDGVSRTQLASAANTRRIVNMAAGMGETDAVNVGQLRQVARAIGGGAELNPDGSVKTPTYSVGGGTYDNVGDALKAVQAQTTTGNVLGVAYDDASKAKLSLQGKGGTVLTNVKAGTADTDAVNVSQLKAAGLVDANGAAVPLVSYDDPNKGALTLGGKGATSPVRLRKVADAQADNDAVNLKQLKSAGLVDAKGSAMDAVVYDSGSAKAQVTFAGLNGTVLANVGDGRIAAGSREAVNGGQVAALRDSLKSAVDGLDGRVSTLESAPPVSVSGGSDPLVQVRGPGANANAGVADSSGVAVGADTVVEANGGVAIGSGAKVQAQATNAVALGKGAIADRANTVSLGAPGSERVLTNVADGVRDTDVANSRQVRQTLKSANEYTDSRVTDVWSTARREMNDMNRQVNRGIAAASALVNVTPYLPGRTAINAGIASYRGETALGVGLSRWSDNGRFNINAGVSAAREDQPVYRVGVGYVF